MEDKKISFYLKLLAGGNVLCLVLLAGVIGYLATLPLAGADGKPIPKEIITKIPEAIEVKSDAEMTDGAKSGVYTLEITDNGLNPEGLNALAGHKVEIEVANKSGDSYTFEMKSLGVEPATINPGETKSFSVEAPADMAKETGFAYKAVPVTGSDQQFEGVLIFTKGGK